MSDIEKTPDSGELVPTEDALSSEDLEQISGGGLNKPVEWIGIDGYVGGAGREPGAV